MKYHSWDMDSVSELRKYARKLSIHWRYNAVFYRCNDSITMYSSHDGEVENRITLLLHVAHASWSVVNQEYVVSVCVLVLHCLDFGNVRLTSRFPVSFMKLLSPTYWQERLHAEASYSHEISFFGHEQRVWVAWIRQKAIHPLALQWPFIDVMIV